MANEDNAKRNRYDPSDWARQRKEQMQKALQRREERKLGLFDQEVEFPKISSNVSTNRQQKSTTKLSNLAKAGVDFSKERKYRKDPPGLTNDADLLRDSLDDLALATPQLDRSPHKPSSYRSISYEPNTSALSNYNDMKEALREAEVLTKIVARGKNDFIRSEKKSNSRIEWNSDFGSTEKSLSCHNLNNHQNILNPVRRQISSTVGNFHGTMSQASSKIRNSNYDKNIINKEGMQGTKYRDMHSTRSNLQVTDGNISSTTSNIHSTNGNCHSNRNSSNFMSTDKNVSSNLGDICNTLGNMNSTLNIHSKLNDYIPSTRGGIQSANENIFSISGDMQSTSMNIPSTLKTINSINDGMSSTMEQDLSLLKRKISTQRTHSRFRSQTAVSNNEYIIPLKTEPFQKDSAIESSKDLMVTTKKRSSLVGQNLKSSFNQNRELHSGEANYHDFERPKEELRKPNTAKRRSMIGQHSKISTNQNSRGTKFEEYQQEDREDKRNFLIDQRENSRPIEDQDDNEIGEYQELHECRDCGRKFNQGAIERHVAVCKKVFINKRKAFNTTKMRLNGTEMANFNPKTSHSKAPLGRRKNPVSLPDSTPVDNHDSLVINKTENSKWRQQSSALRDAIRTARLANEAEKKGIPLKNIPTSTFNTVDMSLIPCPHCGRRFNDQAAERHIPKCSEIKAKPTRLKKGSGQGLGVALRTANQNSVKGM